VSAADRTRDVSARFRQRLPRTIARPRVRRCRTCNSGSGSTKRFERAQEMLVESASSSFADEQRLDGRKAIDEVPVDRVREPCRFRHRTCPAFAESDWITKVWRPTPRIQATSDEFIPRSILPSNAGARRARSRGPSRIIRRVS
jgi:hypothetical protein